MQGIFYSQNNQLYFQSEKLSYTLTLPHIPKNIENLFFETINHIIHRNLNNISQEDKKLTINIFRQYGKQLFQQIFPEHFQYIIKDISVFYFRHQTELQNYCWDFLHDEQDFLKFTNVICHLLNEKIEIKNIGKNQTVQPKIFFASSQVENPLLPSYTNNQNTIFEQVIEKVHHNKDIWDIELIDQYRQLSDYQNALFFIRGAFDHWRFKFEEVQATESFTLTFLDSFKNRFSEMNRLTHFEQSSFYQQNNNLKIKEILTLLKYSKVCIYFEKSLSYVDKDFIHLVLKEIESESFISTLLFSTHKLFNNYKNDWSWFFHKFYTKDIFDDQLVFKIQKKAQIDQQQSHDAIINRYDAIDAIPKSFDQPTETELSDFIKAKDKSLLHIELSNNIAIESCISRLLLHFPLLQFNIIDPAFDLLFFISEKTLYCEQLFSLFTQERYMDLLNSLILHHSKKRENEEIILFVQKNTIYKNQAQKLYVDLKLKFQKIIVYNQSDYDTLLYHNSKSYLFRFNDYFSLSIDHQALDKIAQSKYESKTIFFNLIKEQLNQNQLQIICELYLFNTSVSIKNLKRLGIYYHHQDLYQLHEIDIIHYNIPLSHVRLNRNFHQLIEALNLFSKQLLYKTGDTLLIRIIKSVNYKTIQQYLISFYNIIYFLYQDCAQLSIVRMMQLNCTLVKLKQSNLILFHFSFMISISEKTSNEENIIKVIQEYQQVLFSINDIKTKKEVIKSFISILHVVHEWSLFAKLQIEKAKLLQFEGEQEKAIAILFQTKSLLKSVETFQDYCWLFEEIFALLIETQQYNLIIGFLNDFSNIQFNDQMRMKKNWLIIQALVALNQNDTQLFEQSFVQYQNFEVKIFNVNILDLNLFESKLNRTQNDQERLKIFEKLAEIQDIMNNALEVETYKKAAFDLSLKLNNSEAIIKNGIWLLEKAQEENKKEDVIYFANRIGKTYFEIGNNENSSYYYKLSQDNIENHSSSLNSP